MTRTPGALSAPRLVASSGGECRFSAAQVRLSTGAVCRASADEVSAAAGGAIAARCRFDPAVELLSCWEDDASRAVPFST